MGKILIGYGTPFLASAFIAAISLAPKDSSIDDVLYVKFDQGRIDGGLEDLGLFGKYSVIGCQSDQETLMEPDFPKRSSFQQQSTPIGHKQIITC